MTALDLKREGQERSLLAVVDDQVEAFLDLVRVLEPGTDFSVNLLRAKLDAYEIPNSARAGLFAKAVALDLIEPLYVTAGPYRVQLTEPSTGRSAHHASVRLYRRTTAS